MDQDGVEVDFVDFTELENVEKALKNNTKVRKVSGN